MTHALEVSQIARTIARALKLNEDLTEAISLGHDLGHTQFGHTGEEILNELLPCGFKHNEQSMRVVEVLESLNLTTETLDGILNHTGDITPFTLEGQIVKIADRIAYLNHDIDDATRAGIIKETDIPQKTLSVLGSTTAERITSCVTDMILSSKESIKMSTECKEAMDELRKWMFDNVYMDSPAKREEHKARKIVSELFYYYKENFHLIESNQKPKMTQWKNSSGLYSRHDRQVCYTGLFGKNLFPSHGRVARYFLYMTTWHKKDSLLRGLTTSSVGV